MEAVLRMQIALIVYVIVVPISREISEICSREISYHFPGIPGNSREIIFNLTTHINALFPQLFPLEQYYECISSIL